MKVKTMITILFVIALRCAYQNFIINVSPSEPLGIYKIERTYQVHRGDIVAVCLSRKYQDLGLRRSYLLPGNRCGKTVPLIKTVIAIPGDTVVLKNDEIIVNGKVSPYVTKLFDSHGRRLEKFARGTYKHINNYWLIGVSSSDSWDSRYWGGLDRNHILFTLRYLDCAVPHDFF